METGRDGNNRYQRSVAATKPAASVALALAAVHAARPKAIREFLLDDLDLGNRRLIAAGRTPRTTTVLGEIKASEPGRSLVH